MCEAAGLHLQADAPHAVILAVGSADLALVQLDHGDVTSEYPAVTQLPGVDAAPVVESTPGDVHAWEQS